MTDIPVTEPEAPKAAHDGQPEHNGNGNAQSDPIAGTEPVQEELFVLEQERRVGLAQLYARGTPVTFEVKLTGVQLKGPANLIAFSEPDVTLVTLARAGKVEVDPTYDSDGNVKEVRVRQNIKARRFFDARSEDAALALRGE